MPIDTWLAILLISMSAAFAISGKYQKSKFIHYAFKPLTMIMIISLAWEQMTFHPTVYGYLIFSGLCISLLGDVFLMLPAKYFRPGLLAFLVAQLLYILAFGYGLKAVAFPLLLIILAYAELIFLFLFGSLGKYRWPVFFYVLAISVMAWLAISRHLGLLEPGSLLAMIGALLFLFSDSVNAVNRFKKPLELAQILILGTYFAAQLLFALSI